MKEQSKSPYLAIFLGLSTIVGMIVLSSTGSLAQVYQINTLATPVRNSLFPSISEREGSESFSSADFVIPSPTLIVDLHENDADRDALSDFAEIRIYKTDPLNPDTDGDGFSDGIEVSLGYNPLNKFSFPNKFDDFQDDEKPNDDDGIHNWMPSNNNYANLMKWFDSLHIMIYIFSLFVLAMSYTKIREHWAQK